jgi:hypothetical protein
MATMRAKVIKATTMRTKATDGEDERKAMKV